MEVYDQLESAPIYSTCCILFNLLAGAIIFNEKKLYTIEEFIKVFICELVAIIGVWIIVKKPVSKQNNTSKQT
jgi:surface polysaccharide O-acyltransferase-like enzyme